MLGPDPCSVLCFLCSCVPCSRRFYVPDPYSVPCSTFRVPVSRSVFQFRVSRSRFSSTSTYADPGLEREQVPVRVRVRSLYPRSCLPPKFKFEFIHSKSRFTLKTSLQGQIDVQIQAQGGVHRKSTFAGTTFKSTFTFPFQVRVRVQGHVPVDIFKAAFVFKLQDPIHFYRLTSIRGYHDDRFGAVLMVVLMAVSKTSKRSKNRNDSRVVSIFRPFQHSPVRPKLLAVNHHHK
ncbi:hypothetical protein K439DRAFT_147503 [Ramaria rubella]|nr:hypothetical protein K439DRAFT_147503 [Ramaria rubella]